MRDTAVDRHSTHSREGGRGYPVRMWRGEEGSTHRDPVLSRHVATAHVRRHFPLSFGGRRGEGGRGRERQSRSCRPRPPCRPFHASRCAGRRRWRRRGRRRTQCLNECGGFLAFVRFRSLRKASGRGQWTCDRSVGETEVERVKGTDCESIHLRLPHQTHAHTYTRRRSIWALNLG